MNINETINDALELINMIVSNADSLDHEMFLNLISSFAILSRDISNLTNVSLSLDEFNEKLSLLLNSFENRDYKLFVDILQYEIKPLLEYWQSELDN